MKCRKLTAHPAHLAVLFHLVNGGEAGTIEALRTAQRVLEAIDLVVSPPEDQFIDWIDPTLIRTVAEWEYARTHGEQPKDDRRRWDPAARRSVTLSEEQFDHARKCFDRAIARAKGADSRSLLALLEALEKAEAVAA